MSSRLSILLVCLLLAVACSPRIITRTEVVYRDRVQKDSLFFRDSIYIKEKVKGDTIYIDRFRDRYVIRDKLRTDTLLQEVHDTTFRDVPVPADLSLSQRFRIKSFWWLILLVAIGFRREMFALVKKII